ncbi:LOW QUALITY PROTEIN: Pkinase domain-containing protein, partial [Cephalotus follicularis]
VVVKKLHRLCKSGTAHIQYFKRDIEAPTKIRHRNIVKLYGCLHARHSYLVYDFLGGGSLAKIQSNDPTTAELDWIKRANVIKGMANALSCTTNDCLQSLRLSSNNVLLDSDYEAHISDFDTARTLEPNLSNSTSFAGTFGYLTPVRCLQLLDGWSWELIMGKHPGDLILSLSSSNSHQSLLEETLDQRLPRPKKRVADEFATITQLALACLQTNPQSLPTIKQVSQKLS